MRKITAKEKEILRKVLYERDGRTCYYCKIPEGAVLRAWKKIYGLGKRGRRLELDRKDNSQDYSLGNCVLACAPCNIAKGSLFTSKEFEIVGPAIQKVWYHRLFIHRLTDPNMNVKRDGKVILDINQQNW